MLAGPGAPGVLALGALFVALLLLSALVSAAETAIFGLPHLRSLRDKGRTIPFAAGRLLADREAAMAGLLLGDLVANLGAAIVAVMIWQRVLPGLSPASQTLLTLVTAGPLILLAGEVLPRAVAARLSERTLLWLCPPVYALTLALLPFRLMLSAFSSVVLRLMGSKEGWRGPLVAELEFQNLVTLGGPGGTLEEDEREMVEGVLDFGNSTAEDIMTPRTELDWVERGDPRDEVAAAFERGGHSRLLVCETSPDKILGFLHYRDFLLQPERPWTELLRQPLVVSPDTRLADLLETFRKNQVFLAVVVDEYGGNKGIVTLNDLVEAVFGEMETAEQEAAGQAVEEAIRPGGEGSWFVRGRTELWEIEEQIELRLHDDRARTVSGFVINTLGHIPEEGESLVAEGWRFTVRQMAGPVIEELLLQRVTPAEPPAEGER